ncbi:hypothetical protein ACLOJK_021868 [Asimina triloba]
METISRPWFFLTVFLLLLFVSKTHFAQLATDTISLEHPLSGNHTIISKGGNFELGFFSPGKSRNYYIGIWYKKISKHTVVWVANRETPLPDTSSELKISEDGNLVLLNNSKIPTWSSNAAVTASNRTIAILLDNGNLVLRDRSNSSSMFWQSFDYPADTWLPEQKIGLNKVTGHRQRLISWRNSEDPAPGLYSLQIEADGTNQYFRMWNDSYRYWNTGIWDGHRFPVDPERPAAQSNGLVRYAYSRYVTNDKENYFVYNALDGYIIRFVLGTSGQNNDWIWANDTENWNIFLSYPPNICDVYAVCGPFGVCNADSSTVCTCLQGFRPLSRRNWEMGDWSSGCWRENDLMCAGNNSGNGERAVFQRILNMKLPLNPKSLIAQGVGQCKAQCLDDCSCTAYSYNASGCFIWNGDPLNLQKLSGSDVSGGDLFVRLSSDGNTAEKTDHALTIVGCGIGLVASLVIVSVLIWRCRRRLQVRALSLSADSLVPFRYRDLRRATNDFAEKLGGGSFGSVYKGILPDASVIAVKKLEGLGQGEKQFRSEVRTVGKIQHVNLVRLRGFCSEGSKRLLVYDFMPNGSLASHLFGVGQSCGVLSWETRYQIALGIAKGLAYLHEECRECILHCDIKPENILLDGAFCPKIADFGMAKLLGREFSRVLTTMRGTFGYLAPEWLEGVAITAKADVYSYGMMVLEIISGCRNSRQAEMSGVDYFPVLAASKIREDGDVLCLLDPRLEGAADIEELNRLCRVACWCIQENEGSRPSTVQLVLILKGVLEVSVPPIPRFLQKLFPIGDTIISSYAEK